MTYRDALACRTRYRRFIRLMQWAACLSEGEAACCIRDYRNGLEYSGEAVNHFGGTRAVILGAARLRASYSLRRALQL